MQTSVARVGEAGHIAKHVSRMQIEDLPNSDHVIVASEQLTFDHVIVASEQLTFDRPTPGKAGLGAP